MRVLMISTDRKALLSPTGTISRWQQYAEKAGQLDVLVLGTRGLLKRGPLMVRGVPGGKLTRYIRSLITVFRLAVFEQRYDLVTVQDPFENGLVGYLYSRLAQVPLLCQVHTDLYSPFFKSSQLNSTRLHIADFILLRSKRIRVVSERIKQSIVDRLHIYDTSISVLPIMPELKVVKHVSPNGYKKNSEEVDTVLTVVRCEPEKDIETLLRAFVLVAEKNTKARLVVAGDGSLRLHLEHIAEYLHIADKVSFVGWVNDVSEEYVKADVYVCASLYEGFGLSLLEAAYYGVPIVSTDVGLVGDWIAAKYAHIFSQQDVDMCAKRILAVLADKEKALYGAKLNQASVNKHLMNQEAYSQAIVDSWVLTKTL